MRADDDEKVSYNNNVNYVMYYLGSACAPNFSSISRGPGVGGFLHCAFYMGFFQEKIGK